MKNILKISAISLFLIVLGSCQSKTAPQDENNEAINTQQEESTNLVVLQQKQLEVMNIALGTAKQINLGDALKVNGQLELPPQNRASVSAIIGGRVQSIAVIEGDYVKKGQVLAQLNNPEFITMQREYLLAKSNISFLEQDYQRKMALLKDGITSAKSFQQAEAAYNDGKSALNAAKSMLQLMDINVSGLENGKIISSVPVVSPINGVVQTIEINIGKFVASEQKMFEIINNEFLHLGLKVFEKDIDKVKIGQKITFSLTTRPDKIYEAEIFALGKAFDMNTRAVLVHAKINGTHDGLLTGMFVEARIVTSSKEVLALPNEAFINEKGLDYVFVQRNKTGDNIEFEKVQVNKGVSDLSFTEVFFINALPKEAVIVTKGGYYLNAEMQKSEFGDED
ncbi:MAG: efflux RND transporter periplasmic adaptor subunit [Lutibacter sp.]|nr:efflux RND transporter periplasmic adaptor subunit [Lutibacter sp.]